MSCIEHIQPHHNPNEGRDIINQNFDTLCTLAFSGITGDTIVSGGTNILVAQTGVDPVTFTVTLSGDVTVNSIHTNTFSANTVSGGTYYSGSTPLSDIMQLFDTSDVTRVQPGTNTYTGETGNLPSVNVSALTVDYVIATGTTHSRITSFSASTLSGGTIYSGSTDLSLIFQTIAGDNNDITRVQPGINTFTGGTDNFPAVNLTGASLDNITVSGGSTFTSLSAATLSGGTIYSGSTNLQAVIQTMVNNSSSGLGFSGWTASTGLHSIIANNGTGNVATSPYSFASGRGSKALYNFSTVLGGYQNSAMTNYHSIVVGGIVNIASGKYSTAINGRGNLPSGQYSLVAGGYFNQSQANYSSVLNGKKNTASTPSALVLNGYGNLASGQYASVANGLYNVSSGNYSLIGNGSNNVASNINSLISNGSNNLASGQSSFVGNGSYNYASATRSAVINGTSNRASDIYATVINGQFNMASSDFAFVGNGKNNSATSIYSVVVCGLENKSYGSRAFVGNGYANVSDGIHAFIGNGTANKTDVGSICSSVVNGKKNSATTSNYTLVVNGAYNIASINAYATILNGRSNNAQAFHSSILNGSGNTILSGAYNSVILGQSDMTAPFSNTVYMKHMSAATVSASTVSMSTGATNPTAGLTSLVLGVATVSTNKVTASSLIFLAGQNTGTLDGELTVSGRTAGASFTIASSSATDDRNVAWWIIEPS